MGSGWRRPAAGVLSAALAFCLGHAPAALGGDVEIHGFLLGTATGRVSGEAPSGDFLIREQRLRIDVSSWVDSIDASMRAEGELVEDGVERRFDVNLRQAYVDYTVGDFDFRFGRQIITWGVGDLLFINDVFPKDWTSFFGGRPLAYLKSGADGLRVRYWSDVVNVEVVAITTFEPDILPTPDRWVLYDPLPGLPKSSVLPDHTYENAPIGVRASRKFFGFDVAAQGYRGFWGTPSLGPDDVAAPTRAVAFYPALNVYGLSAQGRRFGGIVSLEGGYYDSRDDTDGADPFMPNSEARFLAGYQRQLWQDSTLGLQYYGEFMSHFDVYEASLPLGFPAQEEYRDLVTLRFDQLMKHQTWRTSVFAFVGPAEEDYHMQGEISYRLSDEVTTAVGANVFGGKDAWTRFGRFRDNDNVFLRARFSF